MKQEFKVSSIHVPNEIPKDFSTLGRKIILVGEAPGEDEENERRPFVGHSGNLLVTCLGRNGMSREEVGFANLCNYRPAYNRFENLEGSPELQSSLKELYATLRVNKPAVIGALGNWPLHILTGKGSGKAGISAYRGSILKCNIPGLEDIKVIPTYHPAFIVRNRTAYPIFDQDIKRIVTDAEFPETRIPTYEFVIAPDGMAAQEWTERLLECPNLSCDIETVTNSTHILCISFSPNSRVAVVFPWTDYNVQFIRRILENDSSRKIFHFGSFDTEVLWCNGIEVKNYVEDTLVMQHVLNPELPKSLAYLASIYTRQPYYKSSGRKEIPSDQKAWSLKTDRRQLYEYNATDSVVTFACWEAMSRELNESERRATYEYKISLLPVAQHIGRTGLPIDTERRDLLRHALVNRYNKLQHALDSIAKQEINVRSPKLKAFLYDELKLPPRRNSDGNLTTGEDAIVSLIGYVKGHIAGLKTDRTKPEWNRKLICLTAVLKIRGVRQLISNYLNAKLSASGRINSVYKVAATETGRFAGERYVDGTGFNPQTLPRADIEITDEDLETFMSDDKIKQAVDEIAGEETVEEDAEI